MVIRQEQLGLLAINLEMLDLLEAGAKVKFYWQRLTLTRWSFSGLTWKPMLGTSLSKVYLSLNFLKWCLNLKDLASDPSLETTGRILMFNDPCENAQ